MENDKEKQNENEELEKNIISTDANTDDFPEQLDDDEFDKEKEEQRRLKREIKLAQKASKKEKKIEYDENGNVILKPKKSKKEKIMTILIILLIIIAVVGAIVAYIITNSTKPENVLYDDIEYLNAQSWDDFMSLIDLKGYFVLNGMLEETEYTQFYDAYYEAGDNEDYDSYNTFMETMLVKKDEIFSELFDETTIKIENITSVEQVGDTKGFYKIKADVNITDASQSSTAEQEIYVAKIDGEYKIVGGFIPYTIYYGFYYYYMNALYTYNSNNTSTDTNTVDPQDTNSQTTTNEVTE